MKHALVTGGAGFLGRALVEQLRARDIAVRVLALPSEVTAHVEGEGVEIMRGDVLDRDCLVDAVKGVDTVFHMAAIYNSWMPDPTAMYDVNLRGTFHMLEAARRANVNKIVYTASVVALGRPRRGQLAHEDTPYEAWDVNFHYSRSKLFSMMTAEDFASWGLDVSIVCPAMVLGPGDLRPTPSGETIINALNEFVPGYFDGGVSYVDVRDAADVHIRAAEQGAPGRRYIAAGHNVAVHDFLALIERLIGRGRRYVKLPLAAATVYVHGLEWIARRTQRPPLLSLGFLKYSSQPVYYDNTRSRQELGMTYRPIEDTVRDAIADFYARGLTPHQPVA